MISVGGWGTGPSQLTITLPLKLNIIDQILNDHLHHKRAKKKYIYSQNRLFFLD